MGVNSKMAAKEDITAIREQNLKRMIKTLGLHKHAKYKDVQRTIKDRLSSKLHAGDDISAVLADKFKFTATLFSCNMRSMNNKTTSLEGLDLWTYCRDNNALGIAL